MPLLDMSAMRAPQASHKAGATTAIYRGAAQNQTGGSSRLGAGYSNIGLRRHCARCDQWGCGSEHRHTGDRKDQGTGQDPHLHRIDLVRFDEGEPADEQAHCEADTGETQKAIKLTPGYPVGHARKTGFHRDYASAQNA